MLDELGVEFAGFIFYPQSPRYVAQRLRGEEVRKAKWRINKVGVFVNASYEEVMRSVDSYGLHIVQLHGDETPKFCERISDQLETVKVFRIGPDENIEWKVRNYTGICDLFLFDTDGVQYGGTGKKFDWDTLHGVQMHKPFLLSGGIGPDDAQLVRDFAKGPNGDKLFAVDVNSKFELAPGVKDIEKIKTFLQALRAPE